MPINKQSSTFRQDESEQILRWIRAGESALIVGVSGVGKSNLFNHLLNTKIQSKGTKKNKKQYILVRANFHYLPDFTDRSIYSQIMEQFELLSEEDGLSDFESNIQNEVGRLHEDLLNAGDDLLKVQRAFKLAVRLLLHKTKNSLVLLCDQFDDLYEEADRQLFANLRGLRESYKYRLSYIVFARDDLLNLGFMDSGREEFYELLSSNVMGLKPYNREDAQLLLHRVAERNQIDFDQSLTNHLYRWTGGHAGLLRATYLAVTQDKANLIGEEAETAVSLLSHHNIWNECSKIWNSLSLEEQRVLAHYAHEISSDSLQNTAVSSLQLKGLLDEQQSTQLFSPLFAAFVRSQEALWERPLYLDENTRQVWVLGQSMPKLTDKEYRVFHALYSQLGLLTTKDELIEAGWPDAKGGVSDEALIAVISRLRKKIEPDPENPRFLENVRNQGYQLHAD